MRIWLAKITGKSSVGLIPTDEESRSALAKLGEGECVQVKLCRVRSVPMNKRYWAICGDIGVNQEPIRSKESISDELKILAGHYDVLTIQDADGFEVRKPRSINFESLTHDEWMALWPSLEQAGITRFGETFWLDDTEFRRTA